MREYVHAILLARLRASLRMLSHNTRKKNPDRTDRRAESIFTVRTDRTGMANR